jgi:mannan endo-1,4-beta-mannosidase
MADPTTERKDMTMRTLVLGAAAAAVVALWYLATASAGEPVNPNLSAEARQVFKYLESTYEKKVLAGYNVYVHTPDDYEQTGKQAAIWGRDIRWLGEVKEVAEHAKRHGYILTLHWHWHFGADSAWTGKRKTPVDVGKLVTPGTAEHQQAIAEMDAAADKLQVLADARIPVLWRPLHEIDGGWFWWTDKKKPENTAALCSPGTRPRRAATT